ncbi:MAG: hypothetical protein NC218_02300 [Acetobacter sp.]|nr:hypothetical protein [Acetobacter sp.]
MSKLSLLIDVDDTICLTSPKWIQLTDAWMKRHRCKRIQEKSRDKYQLEDSFEMTPGQRSRYLCYMYDAIDFITLKPVDGAQEFIQFCKDQDINVTFVTARPPIYENVTKVWLAENFSVAPPIVMFTRDIAPYTSFFDVLIDNSIRRCQQFSASPQKKSILFTKVLVDREDDEPVPEHFLTADSFEKVKEYILNVR